MKIKNILAIMLGMAALTACSDDDKNKEEVYATISIYSLPTLRKSVCRTT